MNKIVLFSLTLISAVSFTLKASNVQVRQKAPDFTLVDEAGQQITLSDMRGQKVALYFYPKDGSLSFNLSPQCTKQACSIRNGIVKLEEAGITVIGINSGSVASHKKFKEGFNLPFTLLSDNGNKVAKLYGANGWFGLPARMTFLIDESGDIVNIINDIDVASHDQQILNGFE